MIEQPQVPIGQHGQTAAVSPVTQGQVIPAPQPAPVPPPTEDDPLRRDWKELSSRDDWGVPAVYDFGAYELLARELDRWAARFGGSAAEELAKRSEWLRAPKVPGVADT